MCVSKYRRGQVWWVKDDNKSVGSIESKTRPWLIVSNNKGNTTSTTCTCVPLTTRECDGFPLHVGVTYNKRNSLILCEQITTKDFSMFGDYMYTVDDKTMAEVDRKLSIQLGLELTSIDRINALFDDLYNKISKLITKDNSVTTEKLISDKFDGLVNLVQTKVSADGKRSTVIGVPSTPKEEKVVKQKYRKWTVKDKLEYIKDYETLAIEHVMFKWKVSSRNVAQANYSRFKASTKLSIKE